MPVAEVDRKRVRLLLTAARGDWKGEVPERDRLRIIEALELAAKKLPKANRGRGRRKGELGGPHVPPKFMELLQEHARKNGRDPVTDEEARSLWAMKEQTKVWPAYKKSRPGSKGDPGR